jgi:hypothetical protein
MKVMVNFEIQKSVFEKYKKLCKENMVPLRVPLVLYMCDFIETLEKKGGRSCRTRKVFSK